MEDPLKGWSTELEETTLRAANLADALVEITHSKDHLTAQWIAASALDLNRQLRNGKETWWHRHQLWCNEHGGPLRECISAHTTPAV